MAAHPGTEHGADVAEARVWRELIGRLEQRMPQLVEEFMGELAARGLYAPDAVADDDLRETAPETLSMLLAHLAGSVPEEDRWEIAAGLGARRARQGVPLDALTEAVRIDLRVLWRTLRELAGDDHVALLASRFEQVMTVVDDYVFEVQKAFLREQAALRRDARVATARDLARLMNTPDLTAGALERISLSLGIPVDAPLAVLAFDGEHAVRAEAVAEEALARGHVFSYAYRDILCVFWSTCEHGDRPRADFDGIPGVLLDAVGLTDLPRAVGSAREILAAAPGLDGLRGVREVWVQVARARLDGLVPGFAGGVLAPLDDLGEYERDRILSAAATFLASGSVKRTAELEYCHRNTIVNRLAAFRGLTGLDLAVPADAALALVALSARGA